MQDQIDPFGADTLAGLRDQGMRAGGITKVRIDNVICHDFGAAGFNFAASVAEAEVNGGGDRPVSLAANHSASPLFVGLGIENPGAVNDRRWNLGAACNFGVARLSAGAANGNTNAGVAAKVYLVGVSAPVGSGEVKAGDATQKPAGVTTVQKLGLGDHDALSRRTTVYADVGRDGKALKQKAGYELGPKHSF